MVWPRGGDERAEAKRVLLEGEGDAVIGSLGRYGTKDGVAGKMVRDDG